MSKDRVPPPITAPDTFCLSEAVVADRRRDWALDGRELAGLLRWAQRHPTAMRRIRRADPEGFVVIGPRGRT